MVGGNKSDSLDLVGESNKLNDELINGQPEKRPSHKDSFKRVIYIFGGLLVLSLILTLVYTVFLKAEPNKPQPTPDPKPVTTSVKIEGNEDLSSFVYGVDYSVKTSGKNYLVTVNKSPKRVIYNAKEVYRGEDIASTALSKDGKFWAVETIRDDVRSKRDENTKLVQNTNVKVSSFLINSQKWGDKDNSRLLAVSDSGAPVILTDTGKQTPSQYGEALNEQAIYVGATEKFKTSYGLVSFDMSSDGSNWLATTKNPSTKEIVDLFVNNTKKDPLDARILKRLSIDEEGNYLLGFCQQSIQENGAGILGKDCQVSVNGKTRTTISGTVYLANNLGLNEIYAGIDKELKQSFLKNIRSDLVLEHKKDMEEDQNTVLGVYLNNSGDKYAVTTSRVLNNKKRLNLSINNKVIDNSINSDCLFAFGFGEDDQTLFIYELPKPN